MRSANVTPELCDALKAELLRTYDISPRSRPLAASSLQFSRSLIGHSPEVLLKLQHACDGHTYTVPYTTKTRAVRHSDRTARLARDALPPAVCSHVPPGVARFQVLLLICLHSQRPV